jgi:membrane-bound lytic murein transglycosylase D
MISIPKTLVKGLTLPVLAILLSSCANNQSFSIIPDFSTWQTVENSNPEPDDVELENIESKVCLDEELVALSQTGIWDEKPSPNNIALPDSVVYDFPVVLNKKVDMYLNLFQNAQREQFGRWLARSAIYRPLMEKELEEAGLPKDLIYLAMIESGYNQLACSSAKAVGLWQFMQATGKQYDLQVDKYVDERRDPLKSSRAAATYLSELYKEFDDWYLAVAAYNGGPGTIRNGLKKYDVDNFWDLAGKPYLSLETKRYVPKLIAALLIAKDPEKYGFTDISYHEPLRYDAITVGPGMSFEAIALISNSTTKEIQRLNQELRLGKTPLNTDRYEVKIPVATADIATKNLARLHSIVSTGYKTHKVRKGETLSNISKRYNVNKTTILKVNELHNGKLAYGRNLRIPYSTLTYQLLPEGSSGAMAAYKDSLVLHRIKKGDTISKIAQRYNVPPKMIIAWNGLKNVHSIRTGQQLALYIDHGGKKGGIKSVASVASKANIKLVASKDYKKILHQPETGSPYQWYNVKNGDSLWAISRKFSASTAEIKKLNNLTSDLIQPGSILKLKKV